jgi:hypothetical protein
VTEKTWWRPTVAETCSLIQLSDNKRCVRLIEYTVQIHCLKGMQKFHCRTCGIKRKRIYKIYWNVLSLREILKIKVSYLQSNWLRIGRSGDRIPVGARFSAPVQTGRGAHPASCTMGNRIFPGSKERPGRDAKPLPPSSTVGHERIDLYFYSPYGPYGLYRASVPVQ